MDSFYRYVYVLSFLSSAFYPRLKERYSKQWFKPYWCRIPASYTQTSLSGPTRSLSSPSGNRRWNPVSQYRSFIRQILPSLPISHLFVVSCSYSTSLKNDCPELEQELKMEGAAVGSDSDPGLLATLLKKGGQGSPLYMGKRGYHGLTNRYILAPRAVSTFSSRHPLPGESSQWQSFRKPRQWLSRRSSALLRGRQSLAYMMKYSMNIPGNPTWALKLRNCPFLRPWLTEVSRWIHVCPLLATLLMLEIPDSRLKPTTAYDNSKRPALGAITL